MRARRRAIFQAPSSRRSHASVRPSQLPNKSEIAAGFGIECGHAAAVLVGISQPGAGGALRKCSVADCDRRSWGPHR